MNVNHELKVIWWLPSRTGSRATVEIISRCNFWNEQNKVYLSEQYTHSIGIPKGCEDYTIVCNIRNPYSKVLSIWHYNHVSQDAVTRKPIIEIPFSEFLEKRMFHASEERQILQQARKPDIYIRLEHLPEDLRNRISFIDFNRNDLLEPMGNRIQQNAFTSDAYIDLTLSNQHEFELKRDPTNPRVTDYKPYYTTQKQLDIVWEMYKDIFPEFGYSRDFI